VWEFFWPLIVGARLVVAAPGAHRDPARLSAAIGEHGVTTLHFVPSMLQAFIEQWLWSRSRGSSAGPGPGQDVLASGRPGRASSASSAAARHCRRSFATRWQGCCRSPAGEPVRSDRGLDRRDALGLRGRPLARGADWSSDLEHAGLCAGCGA
jgi:non-ribosomal peptide synthetase component F